jgi:hypothetical protein
VRERAGGRKQGVWEEREAALGHEAEKEASSLVSSSACISGSKHIPVGVQVTAAASSPSSTTSSSADEELDPQISSRLKVTSLGKPNRALAHGDQFPIQVSEPMWAPAVGLITRIMLPCI